MEPMTLGSPGNVSPGGYIPHFLLSGLKTSSTSPTRIDPMPLTPGWPGVGDVSISESSVNPSPLLARNSRRVSFAPECSPLTTRTPQTTGILHTPIHSSQQKRKGPPIASLSDSLYNQSADNSGILNTSFLSNAADTLNITNRTNIDQGSSFACDPEEELWVTVFGFHPSSTSSVITWLSSCGIITVRHLPSSPKANWLHVRFSTQAESRRALAKNLQMLGTDIILGVIPCTDKSIMKNWKRTNNESINESSGSYLFSHAQSPISNNTINSPGLRLLAAPETSVEPSLLPRRSTGVVSKAVDYLLGW